MRAKLKKEFNYKKNMKLSSCALLQIESKK